MKKPGAEGRRASPCLSLADDTECAARALTAPQGACSGERSVRKNIWGRRVRIQFAETTRKGRTRGGRSGQSHQRVPAEHCFCARDGGRTGTSAYPSFMTLGGAGPAARRVKGLGDHALCHAARPLIKPAEGAAFLWAAELPWVEHGQPSRGRW